MALFVGTVLILAAVAFCVWLGLTVRATREDARFARRHVAALYEFMQPQVAEALLAGSPSVDRDALTLDPATALPASRSRLAVPRLASVRPAGEGPPKPAQGPKPTGDEPTQPSMGVVHRLERISDPDGDRDTDEEITRYRGVQTFSEDLLRQLGEQRGAVPPRQPPPHRPPVPIRGRGTVVPPEPTWVEKRAAQLVATGEVTDLAKARKQAEDEGMIAHAAPGREP